MERYVKKMFMKDMFMGDPCASNLYLVRITSYLEAGQPLLGAIFNYFEMFKNKNLQLLLPWIYVLMAVLYS